MGARGNISVKQTGKIHGGVEWIWLHTHRKGWMTPYVLQNALKTGQKKDRWRNEAVMGALIFGEMIAADPDAIEMVSLSSYPIDGRYPTLVVNCDKLAIQIDYPPSKEGALYLSTVGQVFSFEEFVALEFGDMGERKAWDTILQFKNESDAFERMLARIEEEGQKY
jgi:hypothetical protein